MEIEAVMERIVAELSTYQAAIVIAQVDTTRPLGSQISWIWTNIEIQASNYGYLSAHFDLTS